MDLIKKMLRYLFVLALIVVIVFALIAGILFIFPNLTLFGFKYASNHKMFSAIEAHASAGEVNLTKVNIETNNYNIIIKPNSDENPDNPDNENLRIVINNNFTGFSKNGLKSLQIKNNATGEFVDASNFDTKNLINFKIGDELTLVLKEPEGLISYGSSNVTVFLPESSKNVEYNLKTNTGKISFEKNYNDTSKVVSTANITLSVKNARGSFNIDNASMKSGSNLNISNYIGRVTINSEKIGNVIINSNSGNFTFKQIGYEGFNGNLTVQGNNPYVRVTGAVFGNVHYQNVVTGFLEVKEIKGDLIYESENGILRVDKINKNLNVSNNSGEITIKQIGESLAETSAVNITSVSASINLGTDTTKIYSLSKITAQTSKIVIKNLATSVEYDISTTKGSVNIDFSNDENQKNLTLTTQSGVVNLKNVYGNMNVETGNGSKIYAQISKIAPNCLFVTDGGMVELVLPAPTTVEKYKLNLMNRQKNKVNVQIGGFSLTEFAGEKDENQYYNFSQIFPQASTTDNVINVKSNSGMIKIHE